MQAIFDYLNTGAIENFISLWDFLNKRFFLHLDQEHCKMFATMKSELIIYYIVACVKAKNKAKLSEFFSTFSHEILSSNCELDLRKWYVIPYLENPDSDKEFAVYFTPRWLDNLRTVLFNYISTVLRSAPPPRLLLLERWFRSETQFEIRTALESSTAKIEACGDVIESLYERIATLHGALADLMHFVIEQKPKSPARHALFDSDASTEALTSIESCSMHLQSLGALKRDARLQQLLGPGTRAVFVEPAAMSSSSYADVSGLVGAEQQLLHTLKTCLAQSKRLYTSSFQNARKPTENSSEDLSRLAFQTDHSTTSCAAGNGCGDARSLSSASSEEEDDAAITITTTGTDS